MENCAEKVPPNPVLSVDNEQHCPGERWRWHLKALEPTKLPVGFMEVLLGFYWVLWAFPLQLNGSTDSFSLLSSPKVTSISSARATPPLGLGCMLNLVNLFTAWFVCVKPEGFLAAFKVFRAWFRMPNKARLSLHRWQHPRPGVGGFFSASVYFHTGNCWGAEPVGGREGCGGTIRTCITWSAV